MIQSEPEQVRRAVAEAMSAVIGRLATQQDAGQRLRRNAAPAGTETRGSSQSGSRESTQPRPNREPMSEDGRGPAVCAE